MAGDNVCSCYCRDESLTLNFASCVIRQTRSLGALVLYSNCIMVFVNQIYDMVVDTQFCKFYGRPFARVQKKNHVC